MKKTRKILAMVACAILLVCISVGATVAYLTSEATVENTFIVGKVAITLDEAKVHGDGTDGLFVSKADESKTAENIDDAKRVQENKYHLFPGHEYAKDPTVHVDVDSENCYLFVKVVNGIKDLESKAKDYKSIENQMAANGWVALDSEKYPNVYYMAKDGKPVLENSGKDYIVFNGFTIDDHAATDAMETVKKEDGTETKDFKYKNAAITINAYAIQADGFKSAAEAWVAGGFN